MSIKRNTDSNADSKAPPEPGNWSEHLTEEQVKTARSNAEGWAAAIDQARQEIRSTRAAIPAALFDARDVVWSDLGEIALAEVKLKQQLDLVRACPELAEARSKSLAGKNLKWGPCQRIDHLWNEEILFERIRLVQMLGKEAKKVDLMVRAIVRALVKHDDPAEWPAEGWDKLAKLFAFKSIKKAAFNRCPKGMDSDDLQALLLEFEVSEWKYKGGLLVGAMAKALQLMEGMSAGPTWMPAHLKQARGGSTEDVLDWADVDGNLSNWLLVKHGADSDVCRVFKADVLERWGVK